MKQMLSLALALLAVPLLAAAQSQDVKLMLDTIVVQAEGSYEADPDLATLTFVVSAEDKQLQRAYETATASLKRIVELAERHGVRKDDVSSGSFNVVPLYEGKKKPRAYRVNTTVTLRVRDLAKVPLVIDDAVESEVAEFRSAAYSLADEEAAKQKAVAEAMRRAQQRAKVAVAENGRQLGTLRYAKLDVSLQWPLPADIAFFSAGVWPPAEPEQAMRAAVPPPPPPPITPQKIKIAATAQCIYQIQ